MQHHFQVTLASDPTLESLERKLVETLRRIKPGRVETDQFAQLRLAAETELFSLNPQGTAFAKAFKESRPSPLIDDALAQVTQAHTAALRESGLSARTLELLRSWVEVTVETRMLQQLVEQRRLGQLQREGASTPPVRLNPEAPLSAADLGRALGGVSDETVRQRERAGELFSILPVGRKRGREYPAFQAWAGIAGETLTNVLHHIGYPAHASGAEAYAFFTSAADTLAGLTPVEALHGQLTRECELDAAARALLAFSEMDRHAAVLNAAKAFAGDLAA